jgi:hypothetical protein
MYWRTVTGLVVFALLALAVLPLAGLPRSVLLLLHRLLRLALAVVVATCSLFHFRSQAVPPGLAEVLEPLLDQLRADLAAFRAAERLWSPWLVLAVLVVITALPGLARLNRACQTAGRATRGRRPPRAHQATGAGPDRPAGHQRGRPPRFVKDFLGDR